MVCKGAAASRPQHTPRQPQRSRLIRGPLDSPTQNRVDCLMRSNTRGRRDVTVWSARANGEPIEVWPDGCRDLIVRLEPSGGASAILTGLDTKPYGVHVPAGTVFIGVRLVPGTMARWESEMEAPPGKTLDLGRVGSFAASRLDSIVQQPDRAAEFMVDAAERWFRPGDCIVEDFLGALDYVPGRVARLGTCARTLRRRIKAATGASPQFWVGLHRVRLAGHAMVFTDDPIADVAFAVGYADQAHMTREMRRWFGVTPAAMRRGASSYGDLVAAPDAFSSGAVTGRRSSQLGSRKYGLNSADGSMSW